MSFSSSNSALDQKCFEQEFLNIGKWLLLPGPFHLFSPSPLDLIARQGRMRFKQRSWVGISPTQEVPQPQSPLASLKSGLRMYLVTTLKFGHWSIRLIKPKFASRVYPFTKDQQRQTQIRIQQSDNSLIQKQNNIKKWGTQQVSCV